jgi:hypothetical protein
MATGAELQKMDDAARELRRLMKPALDWAKAQDEGYFTSFLRNNAEDALLKNIRDTEKLAQEWFTTWRSWAERGLNGTGGAYPVDFYLRVGKDLGSAFATYSQLQLQAGAFVLGQTVSATVSTVADSTVRAGEAVTNVLKGAEDAAKALAKPWPTWVKLLLGAGGLSIAALIGLRLVEKLPNLDELLKDGMPGKDPAQATPVVETKP